MDRQKILEEAFLFEGFEIGGLQIKPLSCNRRTFLRKMGNGFFGGEDDDRDEGEQMAEALFACTKTPPELGSYLSRPGDWADEVSVFAVSLEDHVTEKFQAEMLNEVKRIESAQVEPLGKDQALQQNHA